MNLTKSNIIIPEYQQGIIQNNEVDDTLIRTGQKSLDILSDFGNTNKETNKNILLIENIFKEEELKKMIYNVMPHIWKEKSVYIESGEIIKSQLESKYDLSNSYSISALLDSFFEGGVIDTRTLRSCNSSIHKLISEENKIRDLLINVFPNISLKGGIMKAGSMALLSMVNIEKPSEILNLFRKKEKFNQDIEKKQLEDSLEKVKQIEKDIIIKLADVFTKQSVNNLVLVTFFFSTLEEKYKDFEIEFLNIVNEFIQAVNEKTQDGEERFILVRSRGKLFDKMDSLFRRNIFKLITSEKVDEILRFVEYKKEEKRRLNEIVILENLELEKRQEIEDVQIEVQEMKEEKERLEKQMKEMILKGENSHLVQELQKKIRDLDKRSEEMERKSQELKIKDEEIKKKEKELIDKDEQIKKENHELENGKQELKRKEEERTKKDEQLRLKEEEMQKKEDELRKKNEEMQRFEEELKRKKVEIEKGSNEVQEVVEDVIVDKYEETIEKKISVEDSDITKVDSIDQIIERFLERDYEKERIAIENRIRFKKIVESMTEEKFRELGVEGLMENLEFDYGIMMLFGKNLEYWYKRFEFTDEQYDYIDNVQDELIKKLQRLEEETKIKRDEKLQEQEQEKKEIEDLTNKKLKIIDEMTEKKLQSLGIEGLLKNTTIVEGELRIFDIDLDYWIDMLSDEQINFLENEIKELTNKLIEKNNKVEELKRKRDEIVESMTEEKFRELGVEGLMENLEFDYGIMMLFGESLENYWMLLFEFTDEQYDYIEKVQNEYIKKIKKTIKQNISLEEFKDMSWVDVEKNIIIIDGKLFLFGKPMKSWIWLFSEEKSLGYTEYKKHIIQHIEQLSEKTKKNKQKIWSVLRKKNEEIQIPLEEIKRIRDKIEKGSNEVQEIVEEVIVEGKNVDNETLEVKSSLEDSSVQKIEVKQKEIEQYSPISLDRINQSIKSSKKSSKLIHYAILLYFLGWGGYKMNQNRINNEIINVEEYFASGKKYEDVVKLFQNGREKQALQIFDYMILNGIDVELARKGKKTVEIANDIESGITKNHKHLTFLNDETIYNLSKYEFSRINLDNISYITDKQTKILAKFGDHSSYLFLDSLTSITGKQAEYLGKFKGDFLSLNALTQLTDDQSKNLASFKGEGLYLNGLTSVTGNQAENLAKFKGDRLELNGLISITDVQAESLAKFKGQTLYLDGLKDITYKQAQSLAKFKGWSLNLNGLISLTDKQAKNLAKFSGSSLHLNGLVNISDAQARNLSWFFGEENDLYLNGLTSISDKQAESLADFGGKYSSLHLNGLANISDKQAEKLITFRGKYLIIALKNITDKQSEILARFKGYNLYLDGLTNITDSQTENLAKFKGGNLSLDSLVTLTEAQVENLVKFKGEKLSLNGLKIITDNQAEILAKFEGDTLYLGGLTSATEKQAEFLPELKGKVDTGLYVDYSDNSLNESSGMDILFGYIFSNIKNLGSLLLPLLVILNIPRVRYFKLYLFGDKIRKQGNGLKIWRKSKETEEYKSNRQLNEKIIDIYKILIRKKLEDQGKKDNNILRVMEEVEYLKRWDFVNLDNIEKFIEILDFHVNSVSIGLFSLSKILGIRKYELGDNSIKYFNDFESKVNKIVTDLESYSQENESLRIKKVLGSKYEITLVGKSKVILLEIDFTSINVEEDYARKVIELLDNNDSNKSQIAEKIGLTKKDVKIKSLKNFKKS